MLIRHREVALLLGFDPVLVRRRKFGGRLRCVTRRGRAAIAGPDPDSAGWAAAVAALGCVWRPLRALRVTEVRRDAGAILDVALSGHPAQIPTR